MAKTFKILQYIFWVSKEASAVRFYSLLYLITVTLSYVFLTE